MSVPKEPQNPGPFPVQHGYADIEVFTATYNDPPNPIKYQGGSNLLSHHSHPHLRKLAGKLKDLALS